MQHIIQGTTLPVLEVQLQPGETIFSESGELSWMTSTIQMKTHTQAGGGGGFMGAFKRVVGGGSLFMTEYSALGGPGEIAFAAKVPGHILPVELTPGKEFMVHRHGFLCATNQVELGVGFQQSLGAGLFGGEGFTLQKISGTGTAWLELSGEVVTKQLAAGETLRVHPGHVGAFTGGTKFEITRIPGISNMIFGGDGLFLAALTGPGTVYLQTLPLSKLAHQILEYLPKTTESASAGGVAGGLMGSVVKGMMKR
jgi:uncharacterized protein (TIGR00266 family)